MRHHASIGGATTTMRMTKMMIMKRDARSSSHDMMRSGSALFGGWSGTNVEKVSLYISTLIYGCMDGWMDGWMDVVDVEVVELERDECRSVLARRSKQQQQTTILVPYYLRKFRFSSELAESTCYMVEERRCGACSVDDGDCRGQVEISIFDNKEQADGSLTYLIIWRRGLKPIRKRWYRSCSPVTTLTEE